MRRMIEAMTAVAMGLVLAGCEPWQMPATEQPPVTGRAPAAQEGTYLRRAAVPADPETGADSPADAALIWAQKYAEAAEKINLLQQENRDLSVRNQKSGEQTAKLQHELNQAQKELSEANAMLLEMRAELEKWKASVLGFRQEMRDAQQAQLKALASILKMVGGEMQETPVAPASQPGQDKEPASEPVKQD